MGGSEDPNILRLVSRLKSRRRQHRALLVGPEHNPRLTWDMDADRLVLNRRTIRPEAAFIRHDVFTNMADERPETAYRAYAWYSTLHSWFTAHPEVRCFNRRGRGELLKPFQLHLAASVGLPIPHTMITNDIDLLEKKAATTDLVVKPVNGGDYCQHLRPILPEIPQVAGVGASPAIVQEELVQPDIRVFKIGRQFFCYEIESDALDYRAGSFNRVRPTSVVSKAQLAKIGRVSKKMGLDYSATDLKWSTQRQELVFLEVNSAPMFAAFDQASDGALCDAIASELTSEN